MLIGVETRERRHITRYTLDPVMQKSQDTLRTLKTSNSFYQQLSRVVLKKGTCIGVETKERRHITRYNLDPRNAKVARYILDPEAVKFIFYNRIEENTIKTHNFIIKIKRDQPNDLVTSDTRQICGNCN